LTVISFIVPAHNEEAYLGATLRAIHEAARPSGQSYEIIVVNDASTDATAEIARQHDATVLTVNHRQIAATRNSGGRAARGERLFFVDADTTVSPQLVTAALRAIDNGAVGGGAQARFDRDAPLYARLLLWWLNIFMRLGGVVGGAFQFCTRQAFHAVGGFDERLFGAEDAVFAWALNRQGRFVVLWRTVLTSGRRMRGWRGLQMTGVLLRMGFFPNILKQRSSVKKIWYESSRADDSKPSDSFAVQILNVVLLVLVIAVVSGPLWNLIPWSLTPRDSVLGKVRLGFGIFNCHVGLVAWPCAYFLFRSLFSQTRWLQRIKVTALTAVCLWLGWSATRVVAWFWLCLFDCLVR
jgi:cellulose synthase/poly-beta-1,6-N-acetylglucosamine synthase-like glycosyltransferase